MDENAKRLLEAGIVDRGKKVAAEILRPHDLECGALGNLLATAWMKGYGDCIDDLQARQAEHE